MSWKEIQVDSIPSLIISSKHMQMTDRCSQLGFFENHLMFFSVAQNGWMDRGSLRQWMGLSSSQEQCDVALNSV